MGAWTKGIRCKTHRQTHKHTDLRPPPPTVPRFPFDRPTPPHTHKHLLGLGVKRAMTLGPILPGVPVWATGPESKFPGMKVGRCG